MAKATRLTDAGVRAAKAKRDKQGNDVRTEIPDAGEAGLYLVVQPSGAKSWAWRYRDIAGRPRKLTIGPVALPDERTGNEPQPVFGRSHTLAEARAAARNAAAMMASGRDPGEAKAEAKKAPLNPERDLVRTHVERYLIEEVWGKRAWTERKKAEAEGKRAVDVRGLKRSAGEIQRQFDRYILGRIGNKNVNAITKGDILELVRGIAAPIMSRRVLAASLRPFFNSLVGDGVIAVSPCAGVKAKAAESEARDRVLSHDEIAALWSVLEKEKYPFGPVYKLLLLTGARRSEVGGMIGKELNLEACEWVLPRERAKNDREHVIPLSQMAVDILESRLTKGFIFTTTGKSGISGWSRAHARIQGDAGFEEHWQAHDLRRTFASTQAELGTPVHIVEALLNHVSGTIKGVAAVYNRHSYAREKREAMLIYSRFLGDVILHDGRRIAYAKMTDAQKSAMHDAIRRAEVDWVKFRDDETNWGGEPPASSETKSPRLATIDGVAAA